MLPLALLMNPDRPIEPAPVMRLQPAAELPAPATPYMERLPSPPSPEQGLHHHRPPPPPRIAPRDALYFPGSQTKGVVNYPPYENLDDKSLAEIRKFRVEPFGAIRDTCRHIPYNSSKKDFGAKTGMESLEVFEYSFYVPDKKNPEKENRWTVLWDYNVGLVRITNFFKCLGFSKTIPSRALSQNPGLKRVACSITGGSITAQGYWMPFNCAKALCAKFCDEISGALIPIFGPQFPAECVPRSSPEFGRFGIDPEIVVEATRQNHAWYDRSPETPPGRDPHFGVKQQPASEAARHGGFHHQDNHEQHQLYDSWRYAGSSTSREAFQARPYGQSGPVAFSGARSPRYQPRPLRLPRRGAWKGGLDYPSPDRRDRPWIRDRAPLRSVRGHSPNYTDTENEPPSPGAAAHPYTDPACDGHLYRRPSQYHHRHTYSNASLPSLHRSLGVASSSPVEHRAGEPGPLTPSPSAWTAEWTVPRSSPASPYHHGSGGADRLGSFSRGYQYHHYRDDGVGCENEVKPMLSATPRSQPSSHLPQNPCSQAQPTSSSGAYYQGLRAEPPYYRTAPPTPQTLPEEHFDYCVPQASSQSPRGLAAPVKPEPKSAPAWPPMPRPAEPDGGSPRRRPSSAGECEISVTSLASAAVAAMARHGGQPPSPQRQEPGRCRRGHGAAIPATRLGYFDAVKTSQPQKVSGRDGCGDRTALDGASACDDGKTIDAATVLLNLGTSARSPATPLASRSSGGGGGDEKDGDNDVVMRFASLLPSSLERARKRALSL